MIVTPVSAKSATLRVSHGGTTRPGDRGNLCVELADRRRVCAVGRLCNRKRPPPRCRTVDTPGKILTKDRDNRCLELLPSASVGHEPQAVEKFSFRYRRGKFSRRLLLGKPGLYRDGGRRGQQLRQNIGVENDHPEKSGRSRMASRGVAQAQRLRTARCGSGLLPRDWPVGFRRSKARRERCPALRPPLNAHARRHECADAS